MMEQGQLPFGIDYAPSQVRAYGLTEAHTWPLVSDGKQADGSFCTQRVAAQQAWRWQSIEIARSGTAFCSIPFDIDRDDAEVFILELAHRGDIPMPCWMVTRHSSGHCHVVYNLKRPVLRGPDAQPKPKWLLTRISEFYGNRLGADPGYVQVLSHNPVHSRPDEFTTRWMHEGAYSLDELAKGIPRSWRLPTTPQTGIGRHYWILTELCRRMGSSRMIAADALPVALAINETLGPGALPDSEVRDNIVAQFERYRARWTYYTLDERKAWGRNRGASSGQARRKRTAGRDRAIVAEFLVGTSIHALSRFYGLTRQGVQHIVRRDCPVQYHPGQHPPAPSCHPSPTTPLSSM